METNKKKRTESFASIFGDDGDMGHDNRNDSVSQILLDQLVPFENHPFKLYDGERLDEMVESIKNFGVIVPIVVRKKGLKYEILSGHNRVNAARLADFKTIPTIIKEGISEQEAILIVTETNLMQRSFSDLLHSERATVIATRHNAMKQQGIRNDLLSEIEKLSKAPSRSNALTCGPVDHKLKARDKLGDEYGMSSRSVARYLRIEQLTPELKELIDEGKIAVRAGVDLSYLSQENQEMIEAIVSEGTFKVDMKKATMMRGYESEGRLNWATAKNIITGQEMKKPTKTKPVKIQPKIISKYFSESENNNDIEKVIDRALDFYFKQERQAGITIPVDSEEEEDAIG